MPKWSYDGDDEDESRGRRSHRSRSRGRKRWDDAEVTPAFTPSAEPARAYVRPARALPSPTTAPEHAEAGTVRFFDATKGFGFVAPGRPGPDLFVHITAVRQAGMETLDQGQAVRFERGPGRQPGKEAIVRLYMAG